MGGDPGRWLANSKSVSEFLEKDGATDDEDLFLITDLEGSVYEFCDFTQTEFDYNDAGQTIFVTSRQRLNDATGTGELNGPSGNDPKSRDSYTASWYDSTYDRVEYKYNRQGETIWTKDQNETVHEYTYDDAGRQTADKATSLGTNIDGAVRRIDRSYEVRGMVSEVTSYDATSSGNTVNEVIREYDDVGQLDKEYQEHSGGKDGNTLYVQYNHAGTSDGLRLESIRYPNGRLVHYTYGSAGSDADNPYGCRDEFKFVIVGIRDG